MKNNIKIKFTKWYIKKGYRFEFDYAILDARFICPIWVKPFLIFFSPSIYFNEFLGKAFMGGLTAGLNSPIKINIQET